MTATLELLRRRPSMRERLCLEIDDDDGNSGVLFEGSIYWEAATSRSVLFDDDRTGEADFRRWLTGLALTWLAERRAYPQLLNSRWDVVVSDGDIGSTVLVEGCDDPLVAMLDAIEEWDETPAHPSPGLELYDEGGDR